MPAGDDPDGDGLGNAQECELGTDPLANDSDADGVDDGAEVVDVAAPSDADGDGRLDALESAFADNDGDGRSDQQQASRTWEVQMGRFRPAVVANDGSSSATLEVRINGAGSLARVAVARERMLDAERDATDILFVDDEPVGFSEVELFDDGSHGDRVAADGLYTREGFRVRGPIRRDNATRDQILLNMIVAEDGSGPRARDLRLPEADRPVLQRSFYLGVLDAADVVQPERFGPELHGGPHAINLVDPAMATVLRHGLLDAATDMSPLSHAILSRARGDYDFIVALAAEVVFSSFVGRPFRVSNDATGLGLEVRAPDPSWGSAGRLKSLLAINLGADTPITHELMHTWGVYWSDSLGFDYDENHWGWAGTHGVVGGFDPTTLLDHGDGTFSVELFTFEGHYGTTRPFAEAELYMMGLLDASEVPPIPILRNFSASRRAGSVLTGKGELRLITMQDIIASEGERHPAAADSQKAFDALFVVFSDVALTEVELGFFDSLSEQYGLPRATGWLSFAEATGGRATMNTRIGDAFRN